MTRNPILEGLWATREQLLAEAGGTLEALVAQLQRDERRSRRRFVRPTRRTSANRRAAARTPSARRDD